jgi:hypothetical protein
VVLLEIMTNVNAWEGSESSLDSVGVEASKGNPEPHFG